MTQRSFYTEKSLYRRTFTHKTLHTEKSLRRSAVTHTRIRRTRTHRRVYTEAFTQRRFYTEKFCHRGVFRHTEKLLHGAAFTQRNHNTETQSSFAHRRVFTSRSSYAQEFLHREAFTQRSLYIEEFLRSITNRSFVFFFKGNFYIKKPWHRGNLWRFNNLSFDRLTFMEGLHLRFRKQNLNATFRGFTVMSAKGLHLIFVYTKFLTCPFDVVKSQFCTSSCRSAFFAWEPFEK